jgi:hypothetical protein
MENNYNIVIKDKNEELLENLVQINVFKVDLNHIINELFEKKAEIKNLEIKLKDKNFKNNEELFIKTQVNYNNIMSYFEMLEKQFDNNVNVSSKNLFPIEEEMIEYEIKLNDIDYETT